MVRVVRAPLARATLAWDVPVRIVALGAGTDADARATVRVDPGLELPGVRALEVTTVRVGGRTLLEHLAPVSDAPVSSAAASGTAVSGTLADLLDGLRQDGASGRAGPVPVAVDATPFRVAVLEALTRVPVGARCTYAELAAAAGRPRAVRATASVMARNRVPLVLPCHRVVPSGGGTGRYGWGEDVKVALLAAEETWR